MSGFMTGKSRRAADGRRDIINLFVSRKSVEAQLRHILDSPRDVPERRYELDRSAFNDCQVQNSL